MSEVPSEIELARKLMDYFLYRNFPFVSFGTGRDVTVLDRQFRLIEVEIKRSLSDLSRDFQKYKHRHFQEVFSGTGVDLRLTPTFFYFAVPPQLSESAAKSIRRRCNYAGLIVVYPGWPPAKVLLRARPLCKERVPDEELLKIMAGQSRKISRLAEERIEARRCRECWSVMNLHCKNCSQAKALPTEEQPQAETIQ